MWQLPGMLGHSSNRVVCSQGSESSMGSVGLNALFCLPLRWKGPHWRVLTESLWWQTMPPPSGFWDDCCVFFLLPVNHTRFIVLYLVPTALSLYRRHPVSCSPSKWPLATRSLHQSCPVLWESSPAQGKRLLWWSTPPPLTLPKSGSLLLLRVWTSSCVLSALVFHSPNYCTLLPVPSVYLHTANPSCHPRIALGAWVSVHSPSLSRTSQDVVSSGSDADYLCRSHTALPSSVQLLCFS